MSFRLSLLSLMLFCSSVFAENILVKVVEPSYTECRIALTPNLAQSFAEVRDNIAADVVGQGDVRVISLNTLLSGAPLPASQDDLTFVQSLILNGHRMRGSHDYFKQASRLLSTNGFDKEIYIAIVSNGVSLQDNEEAFFQHSIVQPQFFIHNRLHSPEAMAEFTLEVQNEIPQVSTLVFQENLFPNTDPYAYVVVSHELLHTADLLRLRHAASRGSLPAFLKPTLTNGVTGINPVHFYLFLEMRAYVAQLETMAAYNMSLDATMRAWFNRIQALSTEYPEVEDPLEVYGLYNENKTGFDLDAVERLLRLYDRWVDQIDESMLN